MLWESGIVESGRRLIACGATPVESGGLAGLLHNRLSWTLPLKKVCMMLVRKEERRSARKLVMSLSGNCRMAMEIQRVTALACRYC